MTEALLSVPGEAVTHSKTEPEPQTPGDLHLLRALWYLRPWVCLSTCAGDLLMWRRVSLQNNWCLWARRIVCRDSSQQGLRPTLLHCGHIQELPLTH